MKSKDHSEVITSNSPAGEICGIIMPISATAFHEKSHWDDMLELLSRAIESAGCTAKPVWINSSTDRVSERIIGNIFNYPIVIADITDLNPNVMFELGLRLASKKPTLVIMEEDGSIPFDIRDFHIHLYPRNLSILGMERFISNLSLDIRAKKNAFDRKEYTPFLRTMVIDVVSPDQREVSMNQYVIDQLEELNRRVANFSTNGEDKHANTSPNDLIVSSFNKKSGVYFAHINEKEKDTFLSTIDPINFQAIEIATENEKAYYALKCSEILFNSDRNVSRKKFFDIIRMGNAVGNVPRHICDRYKF